MPLRRLPPPLASAESRAAALGFGGNPAAAGTLELSVPGANPLMRSLSRLATVASSLLDGTIDVGGYPGGPYAPAYPCGSQYPFWYGGGYPGPYAPPPP